MKLIRLIRGFIDRRELIWPENHDDKPFFKHCTDGATHIYPQQLYEVKKIIEAHNFDCVIINQT